MMMRQGSSLSSLFFLFCLLFLPFLLERVGLRGALLYPLLWLHQKELPRAKVALEEVERAYQKELVHLWREQSRTAEQLQPAVAPYTLVAARAVLYLPQRRLLLGTKAKELLPRGAGVLWRQQVVGVVERAHQNFVEVQLLESPGFKVSVRCQRTRKVYVLEAKDWQQLRLKHVPYDDDLRQGDVLVTTGWEGRFPPGMVVGKVEKVVGKEYKVLPVVTVRAALSVEQGEIFWIALAPQQRRQS